MKGKKENKNSKKENSEELITQTDNSFAKILSVQKGAIFLRVNAKPNSKQEGLEMDEDELLVAVSAEPKEGEANKAIIKLLSQEFGIPKSSIVVDKGDTSKNKVLKMNVAQPDFVYAQILKMLRMLKQIK